MGHFAYYGITGNSDGADPIPERGHMDLEALAVASPTAAVGCLGTDSIACWSVTRFRQRSRSTRCTVP